MKELFLLKNGQYELTELGKELASQLEIPDDETVNKNKIDILIENEFNKWYADYEDPVLNGFQYHTFLPVFNERQQQIINDLELNDEELKKISFMDSADNIEKLYDSYLALFDSSAQDLAKQRLKLFFKNDSPNFANINMGSVHAAPKDLAKYIDLIYDINYRDLIINNKAISENVYKTILIFTILKYPDLDIELTPSDVASDFEIFFLEYTLVKTLFNDSLNMDTAVPSLIKVVDQVIKNDSLKISTQNLITFLKNNSIDNFIDSLNNDKLNFLNNELGGTIIGIYRFGNISNSNTLFKLYELINEDSNSFLMIKERILFILL